MRSIKGRSATSVIYGCVLLYYTFLCRVHLYDKVLDDVQDVHISKKISLINGRKELADKIYKSRLTPDLMKQCDGWIKRRNDLIHHLANAPYDDQRVKALALEGNDLVRMVESKVKSCVTHLKKVSEQAGL